MATEFNPYSNFSYGTVTKPRPRMLEIASIPDDNRLTINYMNMEEGAKFGYSGNIDLPEMEGIDIRKLVLGGDEEKEAAYDIPDFAFNRICEADSNERSLHYADKIVTGNRIPVINHPARVLETKRDRIYQHYAGFEGIDVPRTVRFAPRCSREIREFIADEAIRMPFIFRPAGGHNQDNMILVESLDDIEKLERFAFDGRDYYFIEFVDCRDDDGYYRKFRVVVVNGRIYPRHVFIGKEWKIGWNTAEKGEEFQLEEKDFLENFHARLGERTLGNLQALCDAAGLDFFGLDLNLRPDGTLLLFEMNTCMAAFYHGGGRPYVKPFIDEIRAAVKSLVVGFANSVTS